MPARNLQAYEGQYYHVVNRGAQRLAIYLNDNAYHLFLSLIRTYAERYHIAIIALCLMPNHYHILVRVCPGGDLARFIQLVCGAFSRRMNKIQRRTGTIFEGRFKFKHVGTDKYFKAVCRYIHVNPVRAGLAIDPGDWQYSNYQECMGRRELICGEHEIITDIFGGASQYADWVRESIVNNVIGDDDLLRDLGDMRMI